MQAKFAYIDKLPQKQNAAATFGTCLHEALELFNRGAPMDECVERFKETWTNPELLDAVPDVWPKRMTFGGLRETGVQILRDYDSSLQWHSREVIAAEHKFKVHFGRHELSGVVDLLEATRGDSKLKVVDYKGSSYTPTVDSLYLDIQLTIYWWASQQPEFWLGFEDDPKYPPMPNGDVLYERFRGTQREVVWYALRKNRELFAGPRTEKDMRRLYLCLEAVEAAITHNVFVPSISGQTCTLCSYTDVCEAYYEAHP
jgi:CRISPR/Cas system-associated exonuclease Cas4 (RecB family)